MDLKEKYPTSHYNPKPDCKHCGGSGERKTKGGLAPCICIFVSHDIAEDIGSAIGQFAREELEKMNKEGSDGGSE